jgi:predicted DsbA family dithiol-disulfide isomerase
MPPTSTGTGTRWESLLATLLSGSLSQGADISDRSFLIPVALSHGLASSAEEVEAYLDSPAANARVDEETARARTEVGVAAVPSVVVNGRYRVGGMQEPGVFLGLFERIRVK